MDTVMTAELTEIDERRTLFAGVTGAEPDQVATIALDIRRMRELGVLVDIDTHGFSMFSARADWSELGIPQDDKRRTRFRRGSKDLIPAEYLKRLRSLETRFRQSLDRHSFDLQGFKPYRWVPFTAYEKWREEWGVLQDDLTGLKAEILEHYDEFRDALAADFADIAREAWDAIRARRPADAGEFVLVTAEGTFDGLETFADHVVARAVAQMPTPEEVERWLYVDYKNAMVATGADLEAEYLQQERQRTEREQERAAQHVLWQEARTQERKLWLEQQEAEEMQHLRLQAERRKLAAMKEAELEHARQQLAQTASPFQEVFEQFRARIHQDVTEIAASIQRNGHLRGKTAERARGLLDLYRLLGAATNDDELEAALQELRARLADRPAASDGGKYDTATVELALADIAALTHEQAVVVASRADAYTRAGALEL